MDFQRKRLYWPQGLDTIPVKVVGKGIHHTEAAELLEECPKRIERLIYSASLPDIGSYGGSCKLHRISG